MSKVSISKVFMSIAVVSSYLNMGLQQQQKRRYSALVEHWPHLGYWHYYNTYNDYTYKYFTYSDFTYNGLTYNDNTHNTLHKWHYL
jgi:hypothetical protein